MASAGLDIAGPIPRALLRHPVVPPGFALLSLAEAEVMEQPMAELAANALESNPFLDPAFLLPAVRHLREHRVWLATLKDSTGRLTALAPIVPARLGRVAPAVAFWCHAYAPLGTPLVDRDADARTLADFIKGIAAHFGDNRGLVFRHFPTTGPVAELLSDAASMLRRRIDLVSVEQRAAILDAAEVADPRETLQRKKRKELGRQLRRLAELGELAVETVSESGAVVASFEEFLRLEATGWKGKEKTALLSDPSSAAFSRAAVARSAANGHCRIHAIRLDGRPVAMLVSFIGGDTASTWKIAYDETHARFSPGAQLMLEASVALAGVAGVSRIDSCAATDHPMIDHLWRDRIELATVVVSPRGGGLVHRIGLAAARAEVKARGVARLMKQQTRKFKTKRPTQ